MEKSFLEIQSAPICTPGSCGCWADSGDMAVVCNLSSGRCPVYIALSRSGKWEMLRNTLITICVPLLMFPSNCCEGMQAVRSLSSLCLQGCFKDGISDALEPWDWMLLFGLSAAMKFICLSCPFDKNMGSRWMQKGMRKGFLCLYFAPITPGWSLHLLP